MDCEWEVYSLLPVCCMRILKSSVSQNFKFGACWGQANLQSVRGQITEMLPPAQSLVYRTDSFNWCAVKCISLLETTQISKFR